MSSTELELDCSVRRRPTIPKAQPVLFEFGLIDRQLDRSI